MEEHETCSASPLGFPAGQARSSTSRPKAGRRRRRLSDGFQAFSLRVFTFNRSRMTLNPSCDPWIGRRQLVVWRIWIGNDYPVRRIWEFPVSLPRILARSQTVHFSMISAR